MTDQPSSTVERLLHPIPEARQMLGGIGHTMFYGLVKKGQIRLTKIGDRSFVTGGEIRRVAAEGAK